MKVISMNPEAMAALQSAEGEVGKPKVPLRLPEKSLARIRQEVAVLMFGPTMHPTYKERLLQFSAFQCILAGWAADNWQKKQAWREVEA